MKNPVTSNPWQALCRFTAARIALGRTGVSLPTAPQLAFQLAHAKARDAVHFALQADQLADCLAQPADRAGTGLPCITLCSAAANRQVYLQRPDLGRRLSPDSRQKLAAIKAASADGDAGYDVAFVVADGLSALAIESNAALFLRAAMSRLAMESWSIAPICIVTQGRVAIGDEIGELLGAKAVVVLIGERPGLSSPDSMGLYLTWAPRTGLTDEYRNCISNVRPAGLDVGEAAIKLHFLLSESRKRQLSGVALKEEAVADDVQLQHRPVFLLER